MYTVSRIKTGTKDRKPKIKVLGGKDDIYLFTQNLPYVNAQEKKL